MRIFTTLFQLAIVALLFACDQKNPASEVDPKLGRDCFESQRAALPPGTQYEGIEKLVEDRLTIRIMNGVDVVTLDCRLNPDGTLQNAAQ